MYVHVVKFKLRGCPTGRWLFAVSFLKACKRMRSKLSSINVKFLVRYSSLMTFWPLVRTWILRPARQFWVGRVWAMCDQKCKRITDAFSFAMTHSPIKHSWFDRLSSPIKHDSIRTYARIRPLLTFVKVYEESHSTTSQLQHAFTKQIAKNHLRNLN